MVVHSDNIKTKKNKRDKTIDLDNESQIELSIQNVLIIKSWKSLIREKQSL